MYAAIKTNTIKEMDLRLHCSCPSINGFCRRFSGAGAPPNGYRPPLKLPTYGAGLYSQKTTAVYNLLATPWVFYSL